MFQKFTTSLLLVMLVLSFSSSYSNTKNGREYKNKVVDGSEIGMPNNRKFVEPVRDNNLQPMTVNTYTVSYSPLGLASYYDLQSNSTPNEVWQDPLNPLYVHAAAMVLPQFGGVRVVNYLLSTNRGVTWDNFGNVAEVSSGFPSIDGLSDGVALITMHTTAGGVAAARSQVFVDLGPGFGTFTRLDPGQNAGGDQIWGRVIGTSSITNPSKYVLAASQNAGLIAATINGTNLGPSPGSFGPWQNFPADNAEQYCLALGQDGRIGNAYISDNSIGDVYFRESLDGGVTWGTPTLVFDANLAADSLGAFRGISMVYLGNTPCVTFEVDMITETGYFPGLPSTIRYWNPTVNGGVPKIVASENNVPFAPNGGPQPGVMTPLCRPAIGKTNSSASNVLFLAMNAATSVTAADSNTYFAIYFMVSYNGGNTWGAPERITPTTPLKDYRYVSISHTSAPNDAGDKWLAQMIVQNHDYAGAFAPAEPPGPADFVSVRVDVPFTAINEISSVVPSSFSLLQNYPNPFNPSTSIRFDIQKSSRVTLEVYNANGQKVETLINNEFVSPGTKEVTFSGSNLSSGVYYYTLSAGDIKETKKMMLIK